MGIKSIFKYNYKLFCAKDTFNWKWLPKSSLGLEPGDEVLKVNNNDVTSYSFLKKIKAVVTEYECAELVLACQETFGQEYKYVYSTPLIPSKMNEWDGVLGLHDEYCPHQDSHLTKF